MPRFRKLFEGGGQNNGTAFYGSHEFDGVFALYPLASHNEPI